MEKPILLHKIRLPLFKSSLWVIISKSIAESIDHVEDITSLKISEEDTKCWLSAYSYAGILDDDSKKFMLFLKYNASPGEIAHEVKHIINIIFSWNEYKLSLTNDEMECRYLEDIVDKVYYSIKKYKKINKLK